MKTITINSEDLDPRQKHHLLLGIVVPRPIALISTVAVDGSPNLAPYSFFQAISANPPSVLFCPTRDRNSNIKHSLLNAQETREFVACSVTEEMAEKMNLASAEFPDGVSEFREAGFTSVPSELVRPFLVEESPVNMECRVLHIVDLSDKPLSGAVVIGEVVRFHIKENVFDADKMIIKPEYYNLISRLGGASYGRIQDTFDMPRPQLSEDGKVIPGSYSKKA